MSVTLYLKFASETSAKTSLRSKGMMAPIDPLTGEEDFQAPGYLDGVRFDVSLCGGDGTYRKIVEAPQGDGPPVCEDQPGFHLQILWHSDDVAPPRFGTARIYPETPSETFSE